MTFIDMAQTGMIASSALARTQSGSASPQSALAGDSEQAYPANFGAGRQAWMREMERAQTSGWFQPFNEAPLASEDVKPSGRVLPSASVATRSPVTFAHLTPSSIQNDDAPTQDPTALQQASFAAEAALDSYSTAPKPVSTVAPTAEGAADAAAAGNGQEDVQEPGAVVQEASAPERALDSARVSQGGSSYQAGGLRGDASRTLDTNGLLKKPSLAPLVPVSLQAASLPKVLSSPSLKDLVSAKATAAPSQHVDDADGPLSSASLARAILAGQTSTRLHSAWTDEGLNLWLGMDGSAQQVSAQAAMIVSTLQQTLKSHGQRLNRVVCNGSLVFDAATPSGLTTVRDFSAELERHASGSPSIEPRSFLSQKETS